MGDCPRISEQIGVNCPVAASESAGGSETIYESVSVKGPALFVKVKITLEAAGPSGTRVDGSGRFSRWPGAERDCPQVPGVTP